MKISNGGAFVTFDEKEDLSEAFDLLCTCGHKLSYHGNTMLWTLRTLVTSQCTMCGYKDEEFVCEQFEIENDD